MHKLREIANLFDTCESHRRFGALVGTWVVLLLAAVNIRVPINDNIPNVLIPISLLREGNTELSEFTPVLEGETEGECYWAVRSERGLYSKYPIWTGVIVTPLFAPFAWWDAQLTNEAFWLRIGRVVSWILSGILAGVLASTLKRFVAGRWAIGLTFLAVFGTALWHHLGSHLTNQTLSLVCLAIVLSLLVEERMSTSRALTIGLISGLAAAARSPAVFVAVMPLGLFLTQKTWRRFIPLVALGGAIFPALTLLYNASAFGNPFTTGYAYEKGQQFSAPMLEGLAGLLISPTCGLFFYSPFLLLGVYVFVVGLRTGTGGHTDSLGRWIALGMIGQWLLLSKWYAWNGALTFGSRLMAETIPGFVLLIAVRWPVTGRRTFLRNFLMVTGATAIVLHLVGTVTYDAVAPTNPIKSDWDFSQDFIMLYVEHFGMLTLLRNVAMYGAILVGIFLLAGYLASRFLVPQTDRVAND